MQFDFDISEPIYLQVAEQIEDAIFTGAFPANNQIPSTTEISKQFHINPATVLKGMNILVNEGLLEKRRGMGTFVTIDGQKRVVEKRHSQFYENFVVDMIHEADKLKLGQDEVLKLIQRGYQHDND
ncbi:GntR family transcriptional regulator [Nicoliella spurrieriana]|uniref:GntR family transcriptional regulator n=1 Tax=Nicoliella spurrieriana TaxID=2925830 RepID=A0A976RSK5_9LACO|nr:GntR family transcriptional regulator [Nicoliella spurrieriana]UQS86826.1 GntR family transcriptional regulator [Nicoliella spurrieriana]